MRGWVWCFFACKFNTFSKNNPISLFFVFSSHFFTHLAVARVGERAAVHDELPAGPDDDARLTAQSGRIVNIERGQAVHNNFRCDAAGEVRAAADGER